MSSETRCVITIDEEHNPPRWIRAEGLQWLDVWDGLGKPLVVFVVLIALLVFAFAMPWFPGLPVWAMPLIIVLCSVIAFVSLLVYTVWFLRGADIRALSKPSDNSDDDMHRLAIRSIFFGVGRSHRFTGSRLNTGAFFDAYRSKGVRPPALILYKARFNPASLDDIELPQHIIGDSPASANQSKWVKRLNWGLLLFATIVLLSLLIPSNRAGPSWPAIMPLAAIFFTALFNIFSFSSMARRNSAIFEQGRIDYTKWFKRQTITNNDALCLVIARRRLTSVQWHTPDRRFPVHFLYFKGPDDPRLATIVNLWTANPTPGS